MTKEQFATLKVNDTCLFYDYENEEIASAVIKRICLGSTFESHMLRVVKAKTSFDDTFDIFPDETFISKQDAAAFLIKKSIDFQNKARLLLEEK